MRMRAETTIALLDAGDGRRLERFGPRIVDRPAPVAIGRRERPEAWSAADLRYDGGRGWTGSAGLEPWLVEIEGLTLELRPTTAGGLGLFPEQLPNLAWLADRIRARVASGHGQPEVLNLFAHTGLLTLAAAHAGAAVVHVDAARAAVAWARRNADLSGLGERPIRWLVDDAVAFVAREERRGRRYDGLVLDPPSFGRSGAHRWRLLDDLPALLEGCRAILASDAFVLLTAHTTGIAGHDLVDVARQALGGSTAGVVALGLDAASGARLDLGWAVRLEGTGAAER